MQVIKRTALLLIGLVLVLMLTLWGFIQNFPGKSIADAASTRLSSQTGINFEIQDFELGWSKLSTPEISISTPNWLPVESKFKCPCHGSGFRMTGIHFEGPAPRPLERFKISLANDGQILVDKTKSYKWEKGEWENPESFLKV